MGFKKIILTSLGFLIISLFLAKPAVAGVCCPASLCVNQLSSPGRGVGSACSSGELYCDKCTYSSLGQIGGDDGFGPWGNTGNPGTDITTAAGYFTKIITNIITVITIVAGLYFIFQFFMAAFTYLTAAGDSKKISSASSKISSAIVGILAVVASYSIISLLGSMLGFDILNPQNIITKLKP